MVSSLYRDLIYSLKQAGFIFYRQGKGSHEIWIHEKSGLRLTVVNNITKISTANGILKQAGIDKKL